MTSSETTFNDGELDAPSYLIVKRGYYYRPNERGYTSSAIQAGRYTLTEAEKITHPNGADGPRDGMTFIHEDEVNDEDWKAYTTLRAQLAEAQKERNAVVATLVEISRWWAKEETRADRAEQRVATLEAALAAQIEADAGIADSHDYGFMSMTDADMRAVTIAHAIRNQPRAGAAEHGSYDRTALDRYREKVLREAYDSLFKHPGFIHAISGQKFRAVKLEDAAEDILALIEKPE